MPQEPPKPLLLVEDDAILLLDVEDMLVSAGFEVATAASGREAIAGLEIDAARYCAIVTDIRLGSGPSGWDVAQRIRELVPAMPVIYMTADSAAEWASRGVPNSLLVPKPFAPPQLVAAITTLLNQAALLT